MDYINSVYSFSYNLQIILSLVMIAIIGMLSLKRSLITVLISLELLLLAMNIGILSISLWIDDIVGYILSLFILTIAAAETSIGLAILINYFRSYETIEKNFIYILKG